MAFPKTNEGVLNYQETEIVFINSSPVKLNGLPAPRVLKRKEDYYMLPRSPVSPTHKSSKRKANFPSGSRAARLKHDFVRTLGTSAGEISR